MKISRIVLLTFVVALFAAGCSKGNVFSLEVGDCFEDQAVGEVQDVPIVECSDPHDNEVYSRYELADGSLPPQQEMLDGCEERFETVVGISYLESVFYAGALMPSSDSWDQGDHEVICYGYIPDEKMTATMVGAAR
jgi:hypothetical protein